MSFLNILAFLVIVLGIVYGVSYFLLDRKSVFYKRLDEFLAPVFAATLAVYFMALWLSMYSFERRKLSVFVVVITAFALTYRFYRKHLPIGAGVLGVYVLLFGTNIWNLPRLIPRTVAKAHIEFSDPRHIRYLSPSETHQTDNWEQDFQRLAMQRYFTNGYFEWRFLGPYRKRRDLLKQFLGSAFDTLYPYTPLYELLERGQNKETVFRKTYGIHRSLKLLNADMVMFVDDEKYAMDHWTADHSVFERAYEAIRHNAPKAYLAVMMSPRGLPGQITEALRLHLSRCLGQDFDRVTSPRNHFNFVLDHRTHTLTMKCTKHVSYHTGGEQYPMTINAVLESRVEVEFMGVRPDVDLAEEALFPSKVLQPEYHIILTVGKGDVAQKKLDDILLTLRDALYARVVGSPPLINQIQLLPNMSEKDRRVSMI